LIIPNTTGLISSLINTKTCLLPTAAGTLLASWFCQTLCLFSFVVTPMYRMVIICGTHLKWLTIARLGYTTWLEKNFSRSHFTDQEFLLAGLIVGPIYITLCNELFKNG